MTISTTITINATKTARKQYYIRYTADFANTFQLGWVDSPAQALEAEMAGWERCTLAFAKRKASNARWEEKINGYCYGSQYIYPIVDGEWRFNPYTMVQRGYCLEYVR